MNVNPASDKCQDDRETLHRECQKALDKNVPCTREKTLILVAFIFSILVLSLLTAVIIAIVVKVMVPQQELCLSRHCITKGASILRTMNMSVDPCEDFYQYACGGWAEHNDIDGDSETAILQKMQIKLYKRLVEIIEKQDKSSAPEIIKKVVNAYDSCLKLYNTPSTDIDTIFGDLGHWPMAYKDWKADDDIKPLEVFFQSYGLNSLFKLEVEANPENTVENIVYISPPNINFYNEDQNFTKIIEMIKKVLDSSKNKYEKIDEDFDHLKKLFEDINVAMNSTNANESVAHSTYNELSTIFPETLGLIEDPKAFFTNVFANIKINGEKVNVENLKFAVKNKAILDDIFKITELKSNPRVLTNYLAIMYMLENSVLLSSYQDAQPRNEKEEKYSCLHFLSSNINTAVDHLYVTNTNTSSLPKVEDVVTHIKDAFSNLMKKYDWIKNETSRANLQRKLIDLKYYIGYPKTLEDSAALKEDYKELVVTGDNTQVYFEVNKFAHQKYFEMAFKKNDRNKWPEIAGWSFTTVNAFYSPYLNIFVLPISILRSPIYHPENFKYLIYGSLGSIIGHEITHGFDTMGRKRNELGQKGNILTPEDVENYEKKSDCFIKQYSDFTLNDGFHMNGKSTVAENIADNGGLHEAYHAYLLWLKQNGRRKEYSLPGLQDKTLEQMFYISFAQTWCEVATLNYLKQQIINDEHSPNKFRVLGSVSNMKEFAEAFKCAKGTKMNPENKCVLW